MHQSDFGVPSPKPTRLLTNAPGILNILAKGEAKFDANEFYMGPLEPKTGQVQLVGRTESGAFRTAQSAAWPPKLCAVSADQLIKHCLRKSPEEGGSAVRSCTIASSSRRC